MMNGAEMPAVVRGPALSPGDHVISPAFDAFVERVENGLEEAFFIRKPEDVIAHFFRAHAPDAFEQFVEKAGVHRAGSVAAG